MDFFDLAARMSAGLDGVRACLLLSDDGLTLASYPGGQEDPARQVWDRLAQIGDPQRGFLDLGDEVWAVVRRGPYTAVVMSAPTVRAGLLLDRIESHLRVAEEARVRESTARSAAKPEVVRRPRVSLHRDVARQDGPPKVEEPEPQPAEATSDSPEPAAAKAVIDLSAPSGDASPEAVDPLDVPLGSTNGHDLEEEAEKAPADA